MAALLRLAAMLVAGAVHSLRMLLTLLPRECHTDVERDRLPAMETGNHQKEDQPAAAGSRTTEALMASRPRSGHRVHPGLVEGSNHQGVLTGVGNTPHTSADALLCRTAEAQSARTGERSGPGGGPPHRLTASASVPHRTVHVASLVDASLPRPEEENRSRVTS
jgi:hypothetical protein